MIGVLLARLWSLGAGLLLTTGVYMILAGISRFVEESFRGEPQTPILAGLRLYQWTAIVMLMSGLVLTSIGSPAAPGVAGWSDPITIGLAVLFGLIAAAAMGVDFPESKRRYARLSG